MLLFSDPRWFVLLVLNLPGLGMCARILCVFPTPSFSHQIVYRAYTQELARLGHQLVIATTNPTHANLTNVREIDLSFTYATWKRAVTEIASSVSGSWTSFRAFANVLNTYLKEQLDMEEFRVALDEKYDLLVVEYLAYPLLYNLKRQKNIPMIGIVSMDPLSLVHDQIGNVDGLSVLYPNSHIGKTLVPKNFIERLTTVADHLFERYVVFLSDFFLDQMKLSKKTIDWDIDFIPDVLMVNANPVLGFSRPVVPTYIDVTGIHIQPAKPLPEDVQSFLDGANEGSVLFSFGSNINTELLPTFVQETFLEVFAKLPYRVLWRRKNTEGLSKVPPNVKIYSWLEQRDLLAHPSMKLFVFQGGYQSMVESVTFGVPLLVIPFYGDQLMNAERIVHLKLGLKYDLKTITKETLTDTVNTIIKTPMYKENIVSASNRLYDTPQNPLERAIWWTDYVLRHKGTEHLRPLVPDLPLYQKLFLDIIAFVATFIGVLLWILCASIRWILSCRKISIKRKSD